eukprot:1581731-Rhodomonas_salina.2
MGDIAKAPSLYDSYNKLIPLPVVSTLPKRIIAMRALHAQVSTAILLRARYAMPGPDMASGASCGISNVLYFGLYWALLGCITSAGIAAPYRIAVTLAYLASVSWYCPCYCPTLSLGTDTDYAAALLLRFSSGTDCCYAATRQHALHRVLVYGKDLKVDAGALAALLKVDEHVRKVDEPIGASHVQS